MPKDKKGLSSEVKKASSSLCDRLQELRGSTIWLRVVVCSGIIFTGVLILFVLLLLPKAPDKRSHDELIRALHVIPIKKGDVKLTLSGYGTAEPIRDVSLSAELKGRIVMKDTDLKEGQLVQKNQILAKIDVADYQIALNEAKAELERLKSEREQLVQLVKDTYEQIKKEKNILDLCISDYVRQRELQRKGISATKALEEAQRQVVSQRKTIINSNSQLNQSKIQLTTTDAQIQKAKALIKMAEINIERSNISSPFKGRINKMYIENDEYVQPGTKLFDVADDTQLEIPVSLDAADVAKTLGLASRDPQKYLNWFETPENIKVVIRWVENPQLCTWEGTISRLRDFCPETRTITLIIRPTRFVKGSNGFFPLVSGMFCNVQLQGITLRNATKIPWSAIQLDGDVSIVDKKGRLEQRDVKIFATSGDDAIITSGLKDKDLLVSQRLPRGMVNGMLVKPIDRTAKGNSIEDRIKRSAKSKNPEKALKKSAEKGHGGTVNLV